MDVLKQISEKMSLLTPKQQKVAKYLLENWEKASFESAIVMARKLGMSQSSVIRTSNALGFEGIPDLQFQLRDFMQAHISTVSRVERASRMQSNDSIEGVISTVLKQSVEDIRGTLQALDADKIKKLLTFIKNARSIYVMGMRSSAALARFLGFNLDVLLGKVFVLDSDHGLYEKIRSLTPDDVLIAISFSRYAHLTVEATRMAHERNVRIIGVTDSFAAPITGLCCVEIVVKASSMHLNNSHAAAMAVFDVLLSALLLSDKDKYIKDLESLEEGFLRLHIFENV
jgi:DNA-binding MurR/RpiR family transcriptional regulator